MLPPSYLDAMPDAFVQLAQQVEDEILQDVARRIGKSGYPHRNGRLAVVALPADRGGAGERGQAAGKYSGKSEATIRRLLKEAATEAMEREDAIYYHYNLEPTPLKRARP